jgi:hypothetical protein
MLQTDLTSGQSAGGFWPLIAEQRVRPLSFRCRAIDEHESAI